MKRWSKVAADVAARRAGRRPPLRSASTNFAISLGKLVAAPKPDRAAIDAKLAEIRAELERHRCRDSQTATVASVLALPAATRARLADEDDSTAQS